LVTLAIGADQRRRYLRADRLAASLYAGPAIMLSYLSQESDACLLDLLCRIRFDDSDRRVRYTYGYATLGELVAGSSLDLILEYAFGAATVASGWSSTLVAFLKTMAISLPPRSADVPEAKWVCMKADGHPKLL